MDPVASINSQLDGLVRQMQSECILDDQFQQLLDLQDETNPDFVSEVVELYFEDSVQKIERIHQLLSTPVPDFNELDQVVHQFKGSSASLGAMTMAQLCIKLREGCQMQDGAACSALLGQVREAFALLKSRLDMFLQLENHKKQMMCGAGAC